MDYKITHGYNNIIPACEREASYLKSQFPSDPSIQYIEGINDVLKGNRQIDDELMSLNILTSQNMYKSYISTILQLLAYHLNEIHPFELVVLKNHTLFHNDWAFRRYLISRLNKDEGWFKVIEGYGIKDVKILDFIFQSQNSCFIEFDSQHELTHLPIGKYFSQKVQKSFITSIFSKDDYLSLFIDALKSNINPNTRFRSHILMYLHSINPKYLKEYFRYGFDVQNGYNNDLNYFDYILKYENNAYHEHIAELVTASIWGIEDKYKVFIKLEFYNPKKYTNRLLEFGSDFIQEYIDPKQKYHYVPSIFNNENLLTHYFTLLKNENAENCLVKLNQLVEVSNDYNKLFINWIKNEYKSDSLAILIKIFNKSRPYLNREENVKDLFDILNKYDYSTVFLYRVIDYCTLFAGKKDRFHICNELASLRNIEDIATELIRGKKANERITGAIILANIYKSSRTSTSLKTLNESIDNESHDETRNVILEALRSSLYPNSFGIESCKMMIAHAQKRKKLDDWNEKYIQEDNLPKIYWSNGAPFTKIEIRYLLYRMKQVNTLQSDIEAKQVILNIDKSASEKFSLFLVESFIESNSDIKIKYYLILSGLMGTDFVLNKLNTLFKKCITDKRVKLAEHVLGAIAMIGSNKALRILETHSRKLANKKPQLSKYAIECLEAAATELNITKDELSDRIIPNFEFDSLYKSIELNGDQYRVFISNEFDLVFIDDNNKSRKSLPKETDKNIVKEFKEIAKEVKEISKTQVDRLQQFMINERKWSASGWKSSFLEHPLMFVFGTKLLWLLKDQQGLYLTAFCIDEDATIYNVNGEEIEIKDDHTISIVHPLHLPLDDLNKWRDKFYSESRKTVFPILERPLFEKLPEELDKNVSTRFVNIDIPRGADWAATQLVKMGWIKQTGDGGSLNFYKTHSNMNIIAYPNIEGPAVFYQGGTQKATLHNLSFSKKLWQDPLTIKEIPSVFYSEIIADLNFLITS